MTRQYIGARYVPKFAEPIEWHGGTSYEALTIVTYNNASYTSKVPVDPSVGNPADNPNYWVLTGNYNAQVEDYRQTVANYRKQMRTVINVKEYGLDNTGVNDCAVLFNNLIAQNIHGTFFFPSGTYLFNSSIILDHHCEIMLDENAKIICGETIEYLFSIAPSNTREEYDDVFGMKRYIISGGTIDCNEKAKIAILVGYSNFSHIYDVKIKGFVECGINIKSGAGFLVDHCLLWGKNGNAEYGYKNEGYDGKVNDTTVVNCNTAFYSNDDYITNSNGWISENGTYEGSICFYDASHTHYSNCVSDTYETSWKGHKHATTSIANSMVINNNSVAVPTSNTVIFASDDISRFKYINLLVLLENFTFSNLDSSYISGINFTDAFGNGLKLPLLQNFNSIIIPTESKVEITSDVLNTLTDNMDRNCYFSKKCIGDYGGKWGHIKVTKTDSSITQTVNISGCPCFTRTSNDNGTNWSDWFSENAVLSETKENITSENINTYINNGNYNCYFEENAVLSSKAGWGHLTVYKTETAIVQIAYISSYGVKTRCSINNGSTWSTWA